MARMVSIAKTVLAASLVFAAAACGNDQNGPIQIEPGFVRTPMTNAPTTAAYLTLKAAEDDTLIAARSPSAKLIELHDMKMVDGVMQMRPLDKVTLPSGKEVTFEPGAMHLMVMQPDSALAEAKMMEITLTFEKAGDITVSVPVKRSADHHQGH